MRTFARRHAISHRLLDRSKVRWAQCGHWKSLQIPELPGRLAIRQFCPLDRKIPSRRQQAESRTKSRIALIYHTAIGCDKTTMHGY